MRHFKALSLIVLINLLLLPSQLLAAQEATFILNPSDGQYNQGDNFPVDLKFNSSESLTSIKSYLKFDPNIIQVEEIDVAESVFPFWWEKDVDGKNGTIKLQASAPSPGQTQGLIAKINFQAVGEGPAKITYEPPSLALEVNDQNILNLTASIGGQFNIVSTYLQQTNQWTIILIIVLVIAALVVVFLFLRKRPIKKK